jgi:hypothetical protein
MSNLLFKELRLLSPIQKSALKVQFHPKVTVVTGENDTGKSSLIKSIYYALGAQPRVIKNWKYLHVKVALTFDCNGITYTMLRDGSLFTLFDQNLKVINVFSSVTKELAPHLAKMFLFKVKLQSHDGEITTPPPAFMYLPFYFDQDKSWSDSWSSFENLSQMKSWRNDLIEYHIGLKPNEYYDAKGEQHELKSQLDETVARSKVLRGIKEQLKDEISDVSIAIDLEEFQEEIKSLLYEIGILQRDADKLKTKLVDSYNRKISLQSQIDIVKRTLIELNSDYDFLVMQNDHIDCPTCGAIYDNSFAEVFDIARDEDKCENLLGVLEGKLREVNDQISNDSKIQGDILLHQARIQEILAKKREQIDLKDLIESESRKKLRGVLQRNVNEVNEKLERLTKTIEALKIRLAAYTTHDWRQEIYKDYKTGMKSFLFDLAVYGIAEENYSTPVTKIKEQGSDHPRALLAHGFAVISLIKKRSKAIYCPIVIDSPIQQEQDEINHIKILNFIKNNIPVDSQLILGVVDSKGIDFGGKVIELKVKRSLLKEEEYEDVYGYIAPLLHKSLAFRELKASEEPQSI